MITSTGERAAAGAKFLDEKSPGWAARIDIETLDVSTTESCVLGQLYGSYELGVTELDLDCCEGCSDFLGRGRPNATQLGFFSALNVDYRQLTAEWKDQILIRRVAHGLSSRDEAATKAELVLTA